MAKKIQMPTGEMVDDDPRDRTFFWKTPFNHNTNLESDRTALFCPEPSLTKQEFVEDADINNIINRFLKTNEPPPMALPEHFLDTSNQPSYFEMQCQLAEANNMFYTLPAEKRTQYKNDPTRWADAVVAAAKAGDGDALDQLGIDTRAERQEAIKAAQAASDEAAEAAKKAANKGETPNPPSDKGK